jgi:hypothetical protein
MQIPSFMHGSENNNSHFKVLQLGPENQEFSCLFQIYIKYDEMLIATSNMLRALFFVVLHVTGIHSYVFGKGGHVIFFIFHNLQICKFFKFLGSFRNRKSANFLCVPVRKSQIRKLHIRKFP